MELALSIALSLSIAAYFSDFGKRLGSAGERIFADVGIAVAHGGAFMTHQGHDDGATPRC